jgi:mannonate dehydratase
VSGFDQDVLQAEGESSERPIRNIDGVPLDEQSVGDVSVTEEQQWGCLKYFLERVIPVAEEANVKLAMHPDDPPLSPIRGIARIMSSIGNYQKLVDLVPSPMNGIGLCQGNFTLMTDDLPSVIRHFGEQKKIHFLHIRDVQGKPEKFEEAFHDDGQTDLVECLRAYRDVGFDGVCRPDHYPKMGDENFNDEHGIARLFAVGYLKGLREAVYAERR